MPSIRITNFGGMKPKEVRSSGGPSRAFLARDVKLWHGTLEPWRYPAKEVETGLDKVCSFFKKECCWIASENACADFTVSDTNCDKVYSTGHMPWPAYAMLPEDCSECCYEELDWCRLGVPKPVNPPEFLSDPVVTEPIPMPETTYDTYQPDVKVAPLVACLGNTEETYRDVHGTPQVDEWQSDAGEQIKREPRSYIYTFVNECGEESAPSDPSEIVDADIDAVAEIGMIIPPLEEGYCDPVSIRIYRGVPSQPTPMGDEPADIQNPYFYDMVNATYLFVAEIPWQEGVVNFTDDVPPDCLEEACYTQCNHPPLECLEGITITDSGQMVAFEGKNLWFSEPYKFHAWDCHLNLDDCIKQIKYVRGQIYVATDGFPYVIDDQVNPDECKCCRRTFMFNEPAPITCKRSMVETATGVIWATNTGLIKIDGNSMQTNTHGYLAEDDWQKYLPHKIYGAYNKGRYFGFNGEKGFIWDVSDGVYSDGFLGEDTRFIELSLTPDAVYNTDQNELFMSFGGDLYRWDASNTFMPYKWVSKLNVEGGLRNYSAMKVVFKDWLRTRVAPNPVTMKLYVDDKLIFAREISCSRPFRLPKGFDALNFQIEITGIEEVMEVHMATSMKELVALNNS